MKLKVPTHQMEKVQVEAYYCKISYMDEKSVQNHFISLVTPIH